MKKTSIEWLVKQFFLTKRHITIEETIQLAKELHKQEIMDAFNEGVNTESMVKTQTAEQYYEKTFKE